ncbi:MAG: ABC transporter substrate-binding protein [Hyphomicrobiaceae bacterium]
MKRSNSINLSLGPRKSAHQIDTSLKSLRVKPGRNKCGSAKIEEGDHIYRNHSAILAHDLHITPAQVDEYGPEAPVNAFGQAPQQKWIEMPRTLPWTDRSMHRPNRTFQTPPMTRLAPCRGAHRRIATLFLRRAANTLRWLVNSPQELSRISSYSSAIQRLNPKLSNTADAAARSLTAKRPSPNLSHHRANHTKRERIAAIAVIFAQSALTCFSLSIGAAAADKPGPLKIAVAGPMSGASAHLGQAMVDAVQLRADEINALGGFGGRRIELISHDDKNDPHEAASVAELITAKDDILLVIGHRTSGASIAAAPIYKKNKIPAISGTATADALTLNNPWYFRGIYNNSLQAKFIANYINSIMKFRTATLISTTSAYGKSLAKAFTDAVDLLPLKIAHKYQMESDSDEIDLDMADAVSELSTLPDSGIVFLAMNAANAAHFVREMRNSGFTFPIFGADSINQEFPNYFEADPILKTSQGDFTDQIYATTSMIWDVANEKAVLFRNAFRKKFQRTPDSGTALYYDTASIAFSAVEQAIKEGGNGDIADDREKIRRLLSNIDSREKAYNGVTGKIYFDSSGNAVKAVPVGIFELSEFISAPVQLEPVLNPTAVPGFSDKLEAGKIITFGDGYMHATQIIYMGIDVNEISNLNTSTGNYDLDFYFWIRYRGRLDVSKIEFSNAVDAVELKNPIWSRERNGMNIVTYKVRGTFHGEFQFKDYPFDRQHVVLAILHRDRNSESLRFVIDRLGMRLTGRDVTLLKRVKEDDIFKTSLGWQITDATIFQDLVKTSSTLGETRFFSGETEVNFSRMLLRLEISRHLTSYSTTILLPMTILFVIGLLIFVVDIGEVAPRFSGGILVLVTVSLLRARLSNDLPNIGYLVAIDYIFFALQIIMWFGILVSVTCFWLLRHDHAVTAQRVNLIGACIYPLPVFAVLLYLWLTIDLPPIR